MQFPRSIDDLLSSWTEDFDQRGRPEVLTRLFHDAVPVLKVLDWRVIQTERGFAESVLPLSEASTNHHCTHQAAVMMIAADYTGGIALSTLFHKTPIIGVHPQRSDFGAALWGAEGKIRWILPSSDDLVCRARIPQVDWERIAGRFLDGRLVLEPVVVDMMNGDQIVAKAKMTYWVRDSRQIRVRAFDVSRIHTLHKHALNASTRLVAGLRSMEEWKSEDKRLFSDPYASQVAGTHGRLLAARFCSLAPQIQPLVAARTADLDRELQLFVTKGGRQIVNLGCGLDTRPWRLALPNARYFEMDLPSVLAEREVVMGRLPCCAQPQRIPFPADFRQHDVGQLLVDSHEFAPDEPAFVFWEGGSMYFTAEESFRLLRCLSKAMASPLSRIWLDSVDASVIEGTSGHWEVQLFMDAMCRLGEPFLTGWGEIGNAISSWFDVVEHNTASRYLGAADPVYDLYHFASLKLR